ncbi:MAG TPA: primosomal replication protein N [Burkholderiales bacterium]|nr:primosomal replication protein N [Burkholderiales bacterium]
MSRNEVALTGTLVERGELRFTPSGLPALNFRIGHVSDQVEAGRSRSVALEIDGVALGELAERLVKLATGVECRFEGFLAQKSRLSRHNVLHVTNFELI